MNHKSLIFLLLVLICGNLFSQVKILEAVRTNSPPKIDGELTDRAWLNKPVASDFIVSFPSFGQKASQKTEVKLLYDDDAIYIGAYLYDDPHLIRKQITARDNEQQNDVDFFSVFFDTYHDQQNGFQFLVTAANVQSDARLSPNLVTDFGDYGDKSWDAVWESKVSIRSDGWAIEMKIPYFSLRFPQKAIHDWGLQFMRSVRRNNQTSTWNPVNPDTDGFVNQFGIWQGLKDIKPSLRLSLSPYLSTGYRSIPEKQGYLHQGLYNGGMDVKYGINESFTLDATLIPDFGQVVSDNLVNNLTPYEILFEENRPFFTEGTEIFNKGGLFYSRRVGATPEHHEAVQNSVDAHSDFKLLRNPTATRLYNAIKVSGRTGKKLGVGVFNAVTAPAYALIRNTSTGKDSSVKTEPLANYNIVVLDQALSGRSYLTFTNTNVLREGHNRDANVSALQLSVFDRSNTYQLNAAGRYSKIWGTDPYDGYNTSLKLSKVSGKWQHYILNSILSERYDPNDLGILYSPNVVTYEGSTSYVQNTPTKKFLSYRYSLSTTLKYLYHPYAYSNYNIQATTFWILPSFWDISLTANVNPAWDHDYFELRTPGKFLAYPQLYQLLISGSTDSRKRLFFSYGGTYGTYEKYNNHYVALYGNLRYRFGNRFNLDLDLSSIRETNQLGYAFEREPNGDPIAATRNNYSFSTVLSGIYHFTPRLNITLRCRHYWNKVNYKEFYLVDTNGKLIPRTFINNKDQNVNIFNADAFLTWDFRLGSRIVVAYKNWLGDYESVVPSSLQKNDYFLNLRRQFGLRHGNEVSARFIYFLDYNRLRKKK